MKTYVPVVFADWLDSRIYISVVVVTKKDARFDPWGGDERAATGG